MHDHRKESPLPPRRSRSDRPIIMLIWDHRSLDLVLLAILSICKQGLTQDLASNQDVSRTNSAIVKKLERRDSRFPNVWSSRTHKCPAKVLTRRALTGLSRWDL